MLFLPSQELSMTEHQVINRCPPAPTIKPSPRSTDRFSSALPTAPRMKQSRTPPYEPIQWLKDAGFGAVRVPIEYGGGGASVPQLFELLIELAEADSNVPQALRGHFAFVEDRLNAPYGPSRDIWFKRFVEGDIVGCAWTEIGAVEVGDVVTKVTPHGDSGGSTVRSSTAPAACSPTGLTSTPSAATPVATSLPPCARASRASQSDDWDGFGQRTTGSGTSRFVDAEVDAENIIDFATRFKYQTAFYQLCSWPPWQASAVRHCVMCRVMCERQRIYSHGNAQRVSDDPQVQQVVGNIAAWVYAAEASALSAAKPAQEAYLARFAGDDERETAANVAAEIESAKAQVVVTELIQRATTELSMRWGPDIRQGKSLDRHWRNARTVSSHNPLIYKARIVGDWTINGTEPPFVWQIGNGPQLK
jgi:alkylation response protein AidB-like acyl-CoA dehydrogenase